jgi:hypothetical protein
MSSPPSRPELSNPTAPLIRTGDPPKSAATSRRMSPLLNEVKDDDESEDENGRILLEALGLGQSTPVAKQAEQPNEEDNQASNLSEPTAEPRRQLYDISPRIRPLPALPSLPSFAPIELEPRPAVQITVPLPCDSEDAHSYIFGSTGPRSSTQHRGSACPPPPYASRYSALFDRPPVTQDDYMALQRQMRGLALPEVAPLTIRKRDEKPGQRRLVVENN